MKISLVQREITPFFLMFSLLIILTILIDFFLHQFNLIMIGRYLGIAGTITILLSFNYSLRKREIIKAGSLHSSLLFHELLAWCGSLMILVHGGIHFNAILPWIALIAMLISVISGIVGKFLLKSSLKLLNEKKNQFFSRGMTKKTIEKEIFWDAITIGMMKKWRAVHLPVTIAFFVFSSIHIISILIFWK